MEQLKGNKRRRDDIVLVIQDDFAADSMLNYIKTSAYDIIFHQAAIPRVSYSVEHPYETTITNIMAFPLVVFYL